MLVIVLVVYCLAVPATAEDDAPFKVTVTKSEPKTKPAAAAVEKVKPKKKKAPRLRIATVGFAENWDPRHNGPIIRQAIADAKKKRADVVHFHECALSGYGGKLAEKDYDWDVLREETALVLEKAKKHKIWVVLGSSHRLTGSNKPHNSLYIIAPEGKIVDRYDKRFCTGGDLKSYSPGDHFVTFTINGIKCTALICYDVRFPELYREVYKIGARVIFDSFHNARAKKVPNNHTKIMRTMLQGHAAVNNVWISATNSAAKKTSWPGVFITPDGMIAKELPFEDDKTNLMVNTVNLKRRYKDASAPYRDDSIAGKLNSGEVVKGDPRSEDRTSF